MPHLPRQPYRVPKALRDLLLVNGLELTSNTTASAALLELSQPSVGRRYGQTPWLQLLRQGINSQRLAFGVLRIGGADHAAEAWQGQPGVEWVTLGHLQQQHWQPLMQLELLDAVALQELPPDAVAGDLPYRLLCGPHGWLACWSEPVVLRLSEGLGGVWIDG